MAEKTKTKKLQSKKEYYEEPIAEIARKVKDKKGADFIKEELLEAIEDEYAEIPEQVLGEEDLKEFKEFEKENGDKEIGKEKRRRGPPTREEIVESWDPKTKLGEEVKNGKIKNIDEILNSNRKILEEQIVDSLINVKSDLISIGQAKGKFGGGKRRPWRQTQRKTKEGNVPSFSTMAVIGNENGYVGIGEGKAKETLPARDKAIRKAKLNIMKVGRACAAFDCDCSELHSIPFKVTGKSGSVKVILTPAPQGTGLVAGNELKKVLKLAGIKDVYSRTTGKKRTTFNLIKACINALKKTNVEIER
jgi:small subunit ribosomal protein S5